jgi:hypothetical protein
MGRARTAAAAAGAALLAASVPGGIAAATGGAAERVTIFSRPGILFGSVDSALPGEAVAIQAKNCGQRAFRVVSGTTTHVGGDWTMHFGPGINSSVRAVWRNHTSSPITIRQPAFVTLNRRTGRRLEVFVTAQRNLWRKRVRIQRYDRRRATWTNVRWVVLTDTYARPGSPFTSTMARLVLRAPKGTLVRAVLPSSEARPCYAAGVSRAVRM